eukprot:94463_1
MSNTKSFMDIKNELSKIISQHPTFIISNRCYWAGLMQLTKSISNQSLLRATYSFINHSYSNEWINFVSITNGTILTSSSDLIKSDVNIISHSKNQTLVIVDNRQLANAQTQKKESTFYEDKLAPIKVSFIYVPLNDEILQMLNTNSNFNLQIKINNVYPIWSSKKREYMMKRLKEIIHSYDCKIFRFSNVNGGKGGTVDIREREVIFKIQLSKLSNSNEKKEKEQGKEEGKQNVLNMEQIRADRNNWIQTIKLEFSAAIDSNTNTNNGENNELNEYFMGNGMVNMQHIGDAPMGVLNRLFDLDETNKQEHTKFINEVLKTFDLVPLPCPDDGNCLLYSFAGGLLHDIRYGPIMRQVLWKAWTENKNKWSGLFSSEFMQFGDNLTDWGSEEFMFILEKLLNLHVFVYSVKENGYGKKKIIRTRPIDLPAGFNEDFVNNILILYWVGNTHYYTHYHQGKQHQMYIFIQSFHSIKDEINEKKKKTYGKISLPVMKLTPPTTTNLTTLTWSCTICTFANPTNNNKSECLMCGTKKVEAPGETSRKRSRRVMNVQDYMQNQPNETNIDIYKEYDTRYDSKSIYTINVLLKAVEIELNDCTKSEKYDKRIHKLLEMQDFWIKLQAASFRTLSTINPQIRNAKISINGFVISMPDLKMLCMDSEYLQLVQSPCINPDKLNEELLLKFDPSIKELKYKTLNKIIVFVNELNATGFAYGMSCKGSYNQLLQLLFTENVSQFVTTNIRLSDWHNREAALSYGKLGGLVTTTATLTFDCTATLIEFSTESNILSTIVGVLNDNINIDNKLNKNKYFDDYIEANNSHGLINNCIEFNDPISMTNGFDKNNVYEQNG